MKCIHLIGAVALAVVGLSQTTALARDLNIVGTGDGMTMLKSVSDAFRARFPDIDVKVPPSIGSGGGISAVSSDAERLGRVARPLKPSEINHGLRYIAIAKLPSAFFTHPSTNVRSLSEEMLAKVYSGEISNWQDVGGADLPIRLVRREETDSTLRILRTTMPGWSELQLTRRSKTAFTTQEAIETVRTIRGTIGFGPYTTTLETQMNVLSVSGRFPTDRDYPSAGKLALIYLANRLDNDMKQFIEFCFSAPAQRIIKNHGGVPLQQ